MKSLQATVDFECQDSGYLAKIIIPGGTNDVPVGKVVAIIVDSKEAADAFKSVSSDQVLAAIGGGAPAPAVQPAAAAAPAPVAAAPVAAAPAPVAAPSTAAAAGGRVIATPYAKKVGAAFASKGAQVRAVASTRFQRHHQSIHRANLCIVFLTFCSSRRTPESTLPL